MISTRTLLTLLLCVCSCLTQAQKKTKKDNLSRPNVLLIMADGMGYECLKTNGGETHETPRLDQLAATGIRFFTLTPFPFSRPGVGGGQWLL